MKKKSSFVNIKPNRVGSFTRWCSRHGFDGVTRECIAKGKKASAFIRKKAVFAENAKYKWNHR